MADRTMTSQSLVERSPRLDPLRPRPQLQVALDCDQPLTPPSRHLLDDIDLVLIGRGPARASSRSVHAGARRLELRLPDARVSQEHAQIIYVRGRWILEDRGSKNGTGVNGAPITQAELEDGDLIEIGHTFLLFRQAAAVADERLDVAADEIDAPAPGLATFVAPLAADLVALTQVAQVPVPVVVLGETGTGKEVVARALHALSRRRGAFIAVNCGALSDTLLPAELFGHRRGSFSGATEDRPGLIRSADRGTLFLDEIGELPADSQVAFLRALQEQEVVPIGGSEAVKVDFRVCVATNCDLLGIVRAGKFREDLYARLAGFILRLPPLRDRLEDLALLIAALLGRLPDAGRARFTPAAARKLYAYSWPLNVRELGNCLQTALALAGRGPIDVRHLPETVRDAQPAPPPVDILSDEERRQRDQLVALLGEHRGNVAAVARALGKARTQIHRWLKRYGLRLDEYRG